MLIVVTLFAAFKVTINTFKYFGTFFVHLVQLYYEQKKCLNV